MDKKKDVFLQARVSPEEKKAVMKYVVHHDTSLQALIKDYVMTLIDLNISPEAALNAIREKAKEKPGGE